jgi:uncharacterized damage-inducible protein DinB
MHTDAHKASLRQALTFQRDHVLGILEDLPDAAMRRPVLPSGWTALGLVNHLAMDVERFWFLEVMVGDPTAIARGVADAWHVPDDAPAVSVLALYRREIELANAVIDATPLEQPPANWPKEQWPTWQYRDLQEVLLHVITETAVHAGHLDAVRELIDGRQWLVLT